MTDFLTEAKQIVLELSLRAQGQESSERLVAETSKTLSGLALAAEVGADLEPELMRAAILTPSVVKDPQLCGQLTRALQD
jgi:hypothetical protein